MKTIIRRTLKGSIPFWLVAGIVYLFIDHQRLAVILAFTLYMVFFSYLVGSLWEQTTSPDDDDQEKKGKRKQVRRGKKN